MDTPSSAPRRNASLTLRLVGALTIASFFVALLAAFLGAEHQRKQRGEDRDAATREFARTLSERVAPLLDRQDILRLSVLATAAKDVAEARIVVLDKTGLVRIDTAMVWGDVRLGTLAHAGGFQRIAHREGEQPQRETLEPVRFGGDVIGELRLLQELQPLEVAFAWELFGVVFLCSMTLVAVAAMMSHHWSSRLRRATNNLLHIATGQIPEARIAAEPEPGELADLSQAVERLDRGRHEGFNRIAEGYIELCKQVVEGLERRNLLVPGHGDRTARYALLLADRLELQIADRLDLELACRLHDLGKAWVRPSVLQKQGQFTEMEQESLRKQPMRAAEMLTSVPSLQRVATIIRHQAERFDGSGFPEGLRGERIPLGARILALASTYDLLTTCGHDGTPLRQDSALAHMAEARGVVFDPWLLSLFGPEMCKLPPPEPNVKQVTLSPAAAMYQFDGTEEEEHDPELAEIEVLLDEAIPEEKQ